MTRPSVEALDNLIGRTFPVLDHGYVKFIDYMGSEQAIVDNARISYGDGTKKTSNNDGLIDYLMQHSHTSPFERAELVFEIACPIFVARQMFRHRTSSVNELSGRYSEMPLANFLPDKLRKQSSTNKQASDGWFDPKEDAAMREWLASDVIMTRDTYAQLLDKGVSRELARTGLPLSTYTVFSWKQDLHNLLHLIRLRDDSHAQPEIQVYAQVMAQVVEAGFPNVYASWKRWRKDAVTLTPDMWALVKDFLVSPAAIDKAAIDSLLPRREAAALKELMEK